MTIKIVLCCILIALSTAVGVKISEKYKIRRDIYSSLVDYCTSISANIKYKKDTVDKLIENLPLTLKRHFNVGLSSSFSDKNCKIKCKYLKENELLEVSNFFTSLGSIDTEGQLKLLNYYKEIFKERQVLAESVFQKYSKISVKLGALTGVLIFIIII